MALEWKSAIVAFGTWGTWVAIFSVITFILSLWGGTWFIVRIPADYFVRPCDRWKHDHAAIHLLLLVVRNVVGTALVIAGVAMLVFPGQGILTVLLGISLMSFPGKQLLTDWILQRKSLQRTLNWIRHKRHRPPLIFDRDG